MTATIHHGDCLDVLRQMPDNSVHAIVTDPPYGLANTTPEQVADTIVRWVSGEREYLPSGKGFMGKAWDAFVPPVAVWDEAMRVLKPGGHVLAFAGTRTVDLMTLGLRLAGFDIRDSLAWLHSQGFPKSMDIGKQLDKMAGAEREVIGPRVRVDGKAPGIVGGGKHGTYGDFGNLPTTITAPATDAAKQWEGWGSATKPAHEPIVMARKPFRGTLAANVLEHGTGAINVDACRIGLGNEPAPTGSGNNLGYHGGESGTGGNMTPPSGRWPANVILDEHMAGVLDQQSGWQKDGVAVRRNRSTEGVDANPNGIYSSHMRGPQEDQTYGGGGGASRFFYVAKASKRERPDVDGIKHPTVKPLALMQWLVRLVAPPNGIVLDPFAGSGTTIEAAMLEGFDVTGIEREAEYLPLIRHRIDRATEQLRTEQEAQAEAPDQGAFPLEDIA